MQKKKYKEEKGMTPIAMILLIILLVIIIIVIGLGIIIFSAALKFEDNVVDRNTSYNTSNNHIDNSLTNYNTLNSEKTKAVLNGFKFNIPANINCQVAVAGVSLELSLEDLSIEMLLKVTDSSYEEVMKEPEKLMEPAKNAGYTITQNIKETTINGIKCAYYTCNAKGLHNLIVYTNGNSRKKIHAQVVTLEEMDTEVLQLFAQIVSTAEETIEANSTDADFKNINLTKSTAVENEITYTKNITSSTQAISEIKEEAERQRRKYNNPEIKKMEAEMEEKYDIIAVVLGEMDVKTAKSLDNALASTFQIFPKLKGNITNITIANSVLSNEPMAFARVKQSLFIKPTSLEFPIVVKNEVLLDARYFLNPTRMENAIAKSVKLSFLDQSTTPEAIIAHELGHVIIDLIRTSRYEIEDTIYIDENEGSKYKQFLTEKAPQYQTTAREIVNNAFRRYGNSASFDEFLKDISGYAASKQEDINEYKYEEVCAEAYQDYYTNRENCSKASRLVLEEIIAYYNKYCT